jgi:hypothetical protein
MERYMYWSWFSRDTEPIGHIDKLEEIYDGNWPYNMLFVSWIVKNDWLFRPRTKV